MKCRHSSSLVPAALLLAFLSMGCQTQKSTLIPYRDCTSGGPGWHDQFGNLLENPADRAVREVLQHRTKNLTADHMPLEQVINFCRDASNVNIFVNWTAIQFLDIDRKTPVTLKLRNRSLGETLTAILDQIGGESHPLDYIIDDGVITISTKDDLQSAKYQVVRVFDIRDMLVQPDSEIQPPIHTSNPAQAAEMKSKSKPDSLFQQDDSTLSHRDKIVLEIFELIKTTVAPESWRDAGGQVGSLRELNGQLIVNQTLANQRAVYKLLQDLRETRKLQLEIEAKAKSGKTGGPNPQTK